MSFAFPQVEPETSGEATAIRAPISDYLTAAFDQGVHDSVLNSIMRISEITSRSADDSALLDVDTANKKYGVGTLKFTQPVKESVARTMSQRKRDEMDRQYYLSQSSTMRFIPGMAAGMLGNMMNPVDFALLFVPFVGEERAAVAVAKQGGGALRQAFARGLITHEALVEGGVPAPRLVGAMLQGSLNQSLFEVPNIIASLQDHADYGIENAAFNIFAGGAFAGAIYSAGRLLRKVSGNTREVMMREAMNNFLKDEPVDVAKYVQVDEEALRYAAQFDSEASVRRAYAAIDMDQLAKQVREKYGETVESPAVKLPEELGGDGSITTGSDHASIITNLIRQAKYKGVREFIEEGFVTNTGRFITREEAGRLVGLPDTGYNHLMFENDLVLRDEPEYTDVGQLGVAEHERYNQLIKDDPSLSKTQALKIITDERKSRRDRFLMQQRSIQEALEQERQNFIQDFVAKEKANHDPNKRFTDLKQQEIDKQIAEGKIMPPEQVQEHQNPSTFDGSNDARVEKEIKELEEELKVAEEQLGDEGVQQRVDQILEDAKKYDELVKSVKGKSLDEAQSIMRQIEAIKNRYGGRPPLDYKPETNSVDAAAMCLLRKVL